VKEEQRKGEWSLESGQGTLPLWPAGP